MSKKTEPVMSFPLDILDEDKGEAEMEFSRYREAKGGVSRIKRMLSSPSRIGVCFDRHGVTLIEVGGASSSAKVIGYKRENSESALIYGSEKFRQLLAESVNRFVGDKKYEAWVAIPQEDVEVRRISIPHVSGAHLERTVIWHIKKDLMCDEADYIFDFVIQEKIIEAGVNKLVVLVCAVKKTLVASIRDEFKKIGLSLSGISSMSVALQNVYRHSYLSTTSIDCHLYLGARYSRIDIIRNGQLVISRDIKTGLLSMLSEFLEDTPPLDIEYVKKDSEPSPSDEKKENGSDAEATVAAYEDELLRKLVVDLNSGADSADDEALLTRIPASAMRLVRQIDSTIKHCMDVVGGGRVEELYISGEVSGSQELHAYLGEHLQIPCRSIDQCVWEAADNASVAGMGSSQAGYDAMCLGLALSDMNRDINFLYTYRDKLERKQLRYANSAVIYFCLVLSCVFVVITLWQSGEIERKQSLLSIHQNNLEKNAKLVTLSNIEDLSSDIIQGHESAAKYADKYRVMAVISEILSVTPPEIKLLKISIDNDIANEFHRKKSNQDEAEEKQKKVVSIQGRLVELEGGFSSVLASYLVKLSSSMLFYRPELLNNNKERSRPDDELTEFSINLNVN